jgi:hypothetical protein
MWLLDYPMKPRVVASTPKRRQGGLTTHKESGVVPTVVAATTGSSVGGWPPLVSRFLFLKNKNKNK